MAYLAPRCKPHPRREIPLRARYDFRSAREHALQGLLGQARRDCGAIWPRSAGRHAPEPIQSPIGWRREFHQRPAEGYRGHAKTDDECAMAIRSEATQGVWGIRPPVYVAKGYRDHAKGGGQMCEGRSEQSDPRGLGDPAPSICSRRLQGPRKNGRRMPTVAWSL